MNKLNLYRIPGAWAFDDESRGLLREPFVMGIESIIDTIVGDESQNEVEVIFSDRAFPGEDIRMLEFIRPEEGGARYSYGKMEGWLCPALFKYFETAPEKIFVQITSV